MKELGGYFEIEFARGQGVHNDAIALNSGRNCLKYIVRAQKPRAVYVPAYCCDSLLEPLYLDKIQVIFYHVDSLFEFLSLPDLRSDERVLYINYFGLKSEYIKFLSEKYGKKLIVDNTQAFFEPPNLEIDTFYSARKFFGVPDGGFLYTAHSLSTPLSEDKSSQRFSHLLGRYENDAAGYYSKFKQAEQSLVDQPIRKMSLLTQGIIGGLDYKRAQLTRQRNFWFLHSRIQEKNSFQCPFPTDFVPMVYPYQTSDNDLRERLLKGKIYTATYWVEAKGRLNSEELPLLEQVVYLPLDHRISLEELNFVVSLINE